MRTDQIMWISALNVLLVLTFSRPVEANPTVVIALNFPCLTHIDRDLVLNNSVRDRQVLSMSI